MLPFAPDIPELKGKRVTVMGLGLFGGGTAVTRHLADEGARIVVTDLKPAAALGESIEALSDLPVTFHLGGHREEDFRETDLLVVNPGVPHDSPHLRIALDSGVPLESEMNLFFKRCPARRIVGITGSNGKTTTTALIGELLRALGRPVRVGGNIGKPLIEEATSISPDETVVLELSSFQLEHLGAIRRSPDVSVVMNLTANHLDRHGTMEAYTEAKRQIVRYQEAGQCKVLNRDDPAVRTFSECAASTDFWFSLQEAVPQGTWVEGEALHLKSEEHEGTIALDGRHLPGLFNLQNMAAALSAVAALSGILPPAWQEPCRGALTRFRGVEHRLEFVGERDGVKVYNDSIATNPESTMAALQTLPGPIVLILGGYDKKLPFDQLARTLPGRVRDLILTGATAPAIRRATEGIPGTPAVTEREGFDDAVREALSRCRPGDTLLFSPACASFDHFRNFAERGRRFKKLVQ